MPREARRVFLDEMAIVGEALLELTGAVRINYEMLGNVEPALHAHLFPRSDAEPEAMRLRPVWFYDWDAGPMFDAERDAPLIEDLRAALDSAGIAR